MTINKKSKNERKTLYQWTVRNSVQLGVLLITIFIGIQFYLYVQQVVDGDVITISRPPGVEGFLPIGSLIGLKYWLSTGTWDSIHPAGIVIMGFAMLISLFFKKAFCGWFCPVGTISEWLWKLGRKIYGKNYQLSKWLDIPLRSIKYLLMLFFVWAILKMSIPALAEFLQLPYWKVSDVKMLAFFTDMSLVTGIILIYLVFMSLLIRNFWCRYLCPYGAFVGLFSLISPTKIKRNEESCIDCNLCEQACPAYLPVDKKSQILSAECTGCISCTEVCPVKDTLEFQMIGVKSNFWSPTKISIVVVGGFLLFLVLARLTDHWNSSVTPDELQKLIPFMDGFEHI
ncbi:MAG: 4Fe-4S binding protein [Candidatus Marinimicrobia bacterium]|nr:4Fe-4S binding protein [Candidatus Neomarinimicrobiota bacterium]MBL7022554.1 4Fe-4S binding protein [Candidatus Neomarinimicrobiota bacterium]MBL7108910.1 4Fe-4S binding protein [Candidatus Neomarinimicrobiota bacterium]